MKRVVFLALALLFVMSSVALAAQNVGNVTQKGSVLIFPKIDISGDKDTLVSISNDYFLPVYLKCYWVDSKQEWQDFKFELTADQPIMFSAKYGLDNFDPIPVTVPPFQGDVGELKCWATNPAGSDQISWNHLYGSAKVVDYYNGSAYEYNSWNFAARGATRGNIVGTGGQILLDGAAYDACPFYYLGNFAAVGSAWGFFKDTDLTLVPCKQDLRQDRNPTVTKAKFDIWNENEVKYSGATQCIKCWFEGYLSAINPKFTFGSLHTTAARFRVNGVASPKVCPGSAASPLIGLLVEELDFGFGNTVDYENVVTTASTGNGAGIDPSGFILWDPNPNDIPESPRR